MVDTIEIDLVSGLFLIFAQHPCDLCGKTFVMKWRFKKHTEAHSNKSQKYCHYFNNDKSCPFDEIGCKFRHQHSDECIFGPKCKNKLCHFKHTNVIVADERVVDNQAYIQISINLDSLIVEQKFVKESLPKMHT